MGAKPPLAIQSGPRAQSIQKHGKWRHKMATAHHGPVGIMTPQTSKGEDLLTGIKNSMPHLNFPRQTFAPPGAQISPSGEASSTRNGCQQRSPYVAADADDPAEEMDSSMHCLRNAQGLPTYVEAEKPRDKKHAPKHKEGVEPIHLILQNLSASKALRTIPKGVENPTEYCDVAVSAIDKVDEYASAHSW